MKEPIKLGIILFLITSVCVGLTGLVYEVTKKKIASQNEIAKQEAMKAIIKSADTFVPVEDLDNPSGYEIYMAKNSGQDIGVVIKVQKEGYGGAIELMVGVDTEMSIEGVQILSHSETPGLGANITKENFLHQFIDKKAPLTLVKGTAQDSDIVAISGATISSTAVTNAVNEALSYIKENEKFILGTGGR